MKNALLFLHLAVTFMLSVPLAYAVTQPAGWQQQGERLHYDVRWAVFKAGEAELLFVPQDNSYTITARAWTTGAVGGLAHIRDRIQTTGMMAYNGQPYALMPDTYEMMMLENDYRGHKQVHYRRDISEAVYTNIQGREEPRAFNVPLQTRDVLSALYYLRANVEKVNVGEAHGMVVFDLEKAYYMHVDVQAAETITVPAGTFDTVKVKVGFNLLNSGKEKDNSLFVWVARDAARTPVKLALETRFGSFVGALRAIGRTDSPSAAPADLPETGNFLTGQ